jgi:hypothetical protein
MSVAPEMRWLSGGGSAHLVGSLVPGARLARFAVHRNLLLVSNSPSVLVLRPLRREIRQASGD